MPSLKAIVIAIGSGIVITLLTGIVGFLSAAHLEISFDKLKDFDVTDLKTYKALGTSIRFEYESSQPRDFTAYWNDVDNDGSVMVRKSAVSFKNFKVTSRIQGVLVDEDNKAPYSIVGYYNSNRIVFSHRGQISGVGVYILDTFQLPDVTDEAYVGYGLFENVIEGKKPRIVTQCPFVMIAQTAASQKYPTIESAKAAFPILKNGCKQFDMPETAI